jgi:hypothetical protein
VASLDGVHAVPDDGPSPDVALSCKLLHGQVRINEPTIAAIAIAAG